MVKGRSKRRRRKRMEKKKKKKKKKIKDPLHNESFCGTGPFIVGCLPLEDIITKNKGMAKTLLPPNYLKSWDLRPVSADDTYIDG